jgi:hypothetical protein
MYLLNTDLGTWAWHGQWCGASLCPPDVSVGLCQQGLTQEQLNRPLVTDTMQLIKALATCKGDLTGQSTQTDECSGQRPSGGHHDKGQGSC